MNKNKAKKESNSLFERVVLIVVGGTCVKRVVFFLYKILLKNYEKGNKHFQSLVRNFIIFCHRSFSFDRHYFVVILCVDKINKTNKNGRSQYNRA